MRREDPRAYPLALLAGMIAADLPGPARCPVTVLADTGYPLSLEYTRQVYERIGAPSKELLLVDSQTHLIVVEDLDATLDVLLPRLQPTGARAVATSP